MTATQPCIARWFGVLAALALAGTCTVSAQALASATGGTSGAVPTVAASRQARAESMVTLTLRDVPLRQVLAEIERQSTVSLLYSGATVPLDRHVSIAVVRVPALEALKAALRGTDVGARWMPDGRVVLERDRPRPKEAPASAPVVEDADSGTIVGRVTHRESGTALYGATVSVEGTALRATTNSDGRFRLVGVPAGSQVVRVTYIGYVPASQAVTVMGRGDVTVDVALEKSLQKLDELVTVTPGGMQTEAKALPSPITVITAEDIAAQRPQTIQDVFRQFVPGAVAFDPASSPISTTLTVRGGSSLTSVGSAMKIFIDGVDASLQTATPIDPSSIERIEVIRGPQAATLYGADAAAGVVQIFTKHGEGERGHPQASVQAQAGTVRTPYAGHTSVFRQQYTGGVQGGAEHVTYNLGGSFTQLADWHPTDAQTRRSTASVFGGMRYSDALISIDINARFLRNVLPSELNPELLTTGYSYYSRPQYSTQILDNETYGIRASIAPTSWFRNQVTVGVDRNSLDQSQTRPRLTTPADTLFTLSALIYRKISMQYNASLSGRLSNEVAWSLTPGIDYYRTDSRSNYAVNALNPSTTSGSIQTVPAGLIYDGTSLVTNTGYFAQAEASWREMLFITAGARGDHNSTFGADVGSPIQPRIGGSLVLHDGTTTIKARAAYGRAIRAPAPGYGIASSSAFGIQLANPLLRPERQGGWDGGIDLEFGRRGTLSVTGYTQEAQDLIVLLQLGVTPLPTSQYQNLGRVSNRGVEVEGSLDLHIVKLRAQYGYVRSRIEDLGTQAAGSQYQVGDRPVGVPTHTAGAAISFAPMNGMVVTGGVVYIGSFRQTDYVALLRCFGGTGPCATSTRAGIVDYPGFAKLSASITQRVNTVLDAFLSIDNLTNNLAFEAANTTAVFGRTAMIGLHAKF